MEQLKQVAAQQRERINPDAIFGRIDPRETDMVKLKEMFQIRNPS